VLDAGACEQNGLGDTAACVAHRGELESRSVCAEDFDCGRAGGIVAAACTGQSYFDEVRGLRQRDPEFELAAETDARS
jgi:hypothetical protein